MEIASEILTNTAIATGMTSLGLLAILEITGTIGALIHMWKTDQVSKTTTIILTPIFILIPYIDLIYLGYIGVKRLDKDSFSYKIVSTLKERIN